MHECVEVRRQHSVWFFKSCPLFYLFIYFRQSLSLTQNSLTSLSWLASELQGSTSLGLLSAGVTSLCHHAGISLDVGSGDQSQVLRFAKQALPHLSNLSSAYGACRACFNLLADCQAFGSRSEAFSLFEHFCLKLLREPVYSSHPSEKKRSMNK